MRTISNFFYKIAHWKNFLLFLGLYLIFPVYLLRNAEIEISRLAGKSVGIIDLLFGYQPDRILQMLADYGQTARAYYATVETTIDIAYPIIYTCLFAIALSLLYRNTPYRPFTWVNIVPLFTFIFDIAENIGIVTLLKRYPDIDRNWAVITSVFSTCKWAMLAITLFLLLYGLLRLVLQRFKNSQ